MINFYARIFFYAGLTFYSLVSMAETLPMQERFLDVGYATLWCQQWFTESARDKIPIIFIHGGPGFESGYIIFEESAHMPHIEEEQRYLEVVREFL